MTEMIGSSDHRDDPMYREIARIFGNPEMEGVARFFLLLPLGSVEDVLAFLRTVPAGTAWEALAGLAIAYRAAHPVVIADPDDPDHE
jgi:hypothetical protein